jgi:hypothetical protein
MSNDYIRIKRSLNEIPRLVQSLPSCAKKELLLVVIEGAKSKLDILQCKTGLSPEERWLIHRELEETIAHVINILDFF